MEMVQFDQWLGFLLIAVIGTAGFWIFMFLLNILPYWIYGAIKNMIKENKEKKKQEATS